MLFLAGIDASINAILPEDRTTSITASFVFKHIKSIFNRLIQQLSQRDDVYSLCNNNILYIFSEYVESTKNFELLLSESLLTSLSQAILTCKSKVSLKELVNICVVMLKQFKVEYEKAYKMVSSISQSKYLIYKFRIKVVGKN